MPVLFITCLLLTASAYQRTGGGRLLSRSLDFVIFSDGLGIVVLRAFCPGGMMGLLIPSQLCLVPIEAAV